MPLFVQILHMSLFFIKTKTAFRLSFCPLFLLLKNQIRVSSSTQCGCQRRESLCLPPFRRSCIWKLLMQPDDTLSIFSRKSGDKDLSSSIFFFFLRFQYSESHSLLKGTLALTVSEQKEASSIAQGCLFTGSFIPRNSMDTHYTAKTVCATLPPPPNMRAAGTVGALMAFKCFSKTRKQA